MKRMIIRSTTAALTLAAALLSTAVHVGATSVSPSPSPLTFQTLQQSLESRITARENLLSTLNLRVSSSTTLTGSDRSALDAIINHAESGMTSLMTQTQQATTDATLKTLANEMVVDYRVYVVVAPQVDLTIINDHEVSVSNRLANLEPAIQNLIALEQQRGKNVDNADATFADYKTNVSNAQEQIGQVSTATLLGETPQSYPGSSTVFQAARTNLENARTDFSNARNDLQTLIADLK
ncbi:MAG: hypothetical protein ACP5OR_06065 [Candidatus Dormibacteria bacterium]